MKKFMATLFLLSMLSSSFIYAQCTSYQTSPGPGWPTKYGVNCTGSNSGSSNSSSPSTSYGGNLNSEAAQQKAAAEQTAAKAKAEQEKKWCTENRAAVLQNYSRCVNGATNRWNIASADCPIEEVIVADFFGLARVETRPNKLCMERVDRQLKTDESNCNQSAGLSMCKSHGVI